MPVSLLAALAVLVVALCEGAALACPACAGTGAGTRPWLVALLIAAPVAAFVVTALVVHRLMARPRQP